MIKRIWSRREGEKEREEERRRQRARSQSDNEKLRTCCVPSCVSRAIETRTKSCQAACRGFSRLRPRVLSQRSLGTLIFFVLFNFVTLGSKTILSWCSFQFFDRCKVTWEFYRWTIEECLIFLTLSYDKFCTIVEFKELLVFVESVKRWSLLGCCETG